jgi:hypothetical protein
MVDAARRELIGSVRFRRRKWCSSNTGSNPVLTTKNKSWYCELLILSLGILIKTNKGYE